jgi:hypothetical protein
LGIFDSEAKTHSLIKSTPRLIAAASVLIFVAGCTQLPTAEVPEPSQSQAESDSGQTEEPGAQDEAVDCNQKTQIAIEEVINSQTKAFAESNYELAYSYASESFRSGVSLEGFVAIIASSYGPLIESSKLRFSGCLVNPNTGFGLIDVSFLQAGDFVYGLRYLVTETQEGWRVQGASNLQVVGEGT